MSRTKRTYATQLAQEQLRADNRQIVSKEEYDALCELRDGAHTEALIKLTRMEGRFADLLGVNSEQLARLQRSTLELDGLRTNLRRMEDRDKLMSARVAKLEADLTEAKKLETENAALKEQVAALNARVESSYPARFSTPQPAIGGGK
jgi:hypothetical protein